MTDSFSIAYERLNPEQKTAVDTLYGPVSIIAGPGTGKTQLLTLRIANILQKTDNTPYNILALTFTEAGAIAMRERLRSFIGSEAHKVTISTFHGFCNTLIENSPEIFQFSRNLSSLTELEKYKILSDILQSIPLEYLKNIHDPDMYLRGVASSISNCKRENISPTELRTRVEKALKILPDNPEYQYKRKYKDKQPGDLNAKYYKAEKQLLKNKELADIYEAYQSRLKIEGKYDFEDMIAFVIEKLETNKDFLADLQEQYQFIMVDEFQDTNTMQNNLVKTLLTGIDTPNILVVGDDEQSIYRFQGAIMENVLDFHTTHQKTGITTVVLKENYRSTQAILDASREVIRHNSQSLEKELGLNKELHANKEGLLPISYIESPNEDLEIYFLVTQIKKHIEAGISPEEIAIIYRNNGDALPIIEAFRRAGIPFKKQRGENLLHIAETGKILKTLQVLTNFWDNTLLWEVMLFDFWWLSVVDLMKIQNSCYDKNRKRISTFYDALLASQDPKIQAVLTSLIELQQHAVNHNLVDFFEHFLQTTGYRDFILKQDHKLELLTVLNGIFNEIKLFSLENPGAGISDFIVYLTELERYNLSPTTQPLKIHENAVQLLTAHGSKGLEFEVVFLYKTTENRWEKGGKTGNITLAVDLFEEEHVLNPTTQKEQKIEEERRLFYVALTRAKKHIYISYAKVYGDKPMTGSQFIYEIPEKYIEPLSTIDVDNVELLSLFTSSPQEIDWDSAFESEIRNRIKNYKLSVTHLNNWLESPRKFLIQNLIRVPSGKNLSAVYGTAVHNVLRYITHGIQQENMDVLQEEKWHFVLKTELEKTPLNEHEFADVYKKASETISNYISHPLSPISTRSEAEVRFGIQPIVVEDMLLGGQIDKIEYLDDEHIQVVDYKTGSIKTGKALENYERQLYFYKLLHDGSNRSTTLEQWVLDFVEHTKDDNNRKTFVFSKEKLDLLRKQIRTFKKALEELYFPEEPIDIDEYLGE